MQASTQVTPRARLILFAIMSLPGLAMLALGLIGPALGLVAFSAAIAFRPLEPHRRGETTLDLVLAVLGTVMGLFLHLGSSAIGIAGALMSAAVIARGVLRMRRWARETPWATLVFPLALASMAAASTPAQALSILTNLCYAAAHTLPYMVPLTFAFLVILFFLSIVINFFNVGGVFAEISRILSGVLGVAILLGVIVLALITPVNDLDWWSTLISTTNGCGIANVDTAGAPLIVRAILWIAGGFG